MLYESHCKDDLDIIRQQLGSQDVFISGIVERCDYGFPRIVLLDPVKKDNGIKELNYQAISNLMWLTCPYLNDRIHELETEGLIRRITDFIQEDKTLKSMMRNAHANFYHLRNVIYKKFNRFAESALDGNIMRILKKGIGGIKDFDTLKCLHIHFCHYRVFEDNIAGLMTYRLLDGNLNCEDCICCKKNE